MTIKESTNETRSCMIVNESLRQIDSFTVAEESTREIYFPPGRERIKRDNIIDFFMINNGLNLVQSRKILPEPRFPNGFFI